MSGGVIRRAVTVVLALLCAVVGGAATAYAHTELDNAVPAAGARLQQTPGNIQLTFTEPVDADLARVVVVGPGGQQLAVGPARQSGPGVIQPLTAVARPGTVRVAYRVVSLDGHPVSGTYTFEVLRGDPDARPDGGAGGGATTGGGDADTGSGIPTGPVLGAAALLVVVLAAGALTARRRARPQPPAAQSTPPAS